jgi:DNA repair protein RadD
MTSRTVLLRAPRTTLLNVGEAAGYLGVSAASLRQWSNQGAVPVSRTPGGQRRYYVDDLDQFRDSMREDPRAARGERDPTIRAR